MTKKWDTGTRLTHRLYLYEGLTLLVEVQSRGTPGEKGVAVRIIYDNSVDLGAARDLLMKYLDILQHAANHREMDDRQIDFDHPNEPDWQDEER